MNEDQLQVIEAKLVHDLRTQARLALDAWWDRVVIAPLRETVENLVARGVPRSEAEEIVNGAAASTIKEATKGLRGE